MDATLRQMINDRLNADPKLDTRVGLCILAATESEDALVREVDGNATESLAPTVSLPAAEPARAYLRSIKVEGFRGIGAPAQLDVQPGPGLTLIAGPNGSGKSSFAEAFEMAVAGAIDRHGERLEGWRNLHHQGAVKITAQLSVEGIAGSTEVRRWWPQEANFDASEAFVQPHGRPKGTLASLGWDRPMETCRPFLSYTGLGAMLERRPSELYDALTAMLGLEDLLEAKRRLETVRRARELHITAVRNELNQILGALKTVDDPRAGLCVAALGKEPWDLESIESVVLGDHRDPDPASDLQILRQLMGLQSHDPDRVAERVQALRDAAGAVVNAAGTDADRARRVADILHRAVDLHRNHGGSDCPVCGEGVLDEKWQAAAEAQVSRLQEEAERATSAHRALEVALLAARELLSGPPDALNYAWRVGIDHSEAIGAWRVWVSAVNEPDPMALAGHIENHLEPLMAAVAGIQQAARQELDRRQSLWEPLARRLGEWLTQARPNERAAEAVKMLRSAEQWLKRAEADLRDQRFAPIADDAERTWTKLGGRPRVKLARPVLTGMATRRRVKLEVSVDGVSAGALGILSQGELSCLALSLFLPRVTLPESPFGFIVIDDPVQSMDWAHVDGLAHLLGEVAATRQVIVFTHDDRLRESLVRQRIPAAGVEVTREHGSAVTVRPLLDPVEANLQDARVVVKDVKVLPDVKRRVVPGLCRLALEAACLETARRHLIERGASHTEVDETLKDAHTLRQLLSVVFYDDAGRAGEVRAGLENRFGPQSASIVTDLNRGVHDAYTGDLDALVRHTRTLTVSVRGIAS